MDAGNESSALISLRELRALEDRRVADEQAQARARGREARRPAAEEVRRADEEAQRRAREAERVRRAAEAAAALRAREEDLRLAEAEVRARVEAAAVLEAERLRLEAEGRRLSAPRRRRGLACGVLAVAALLVVLLAVLAWIESRTNRTLDDGLLALEERRAAALSRLEEWRARLARTPLPAPPRAPPAAVPRQPASVPQAPRGRPKVAPPRPPPRPAPIRPCNSDEPLACASGPGGDAGGAPPATRARARR